MELTITDLLKDGGKVSGAFGYWRESGRFVVFEAPAVVLATGGIGKSWKVTSNSWECTGDGHALALRAGADGAQHGVRPVPSDGHGVASVGARFARDRVGPRRRRGSSSTPRNAGSCSTTSRSSSRRRRPTISKRPTAGTTTRRNNRRPPELLPRDEVARAINSEIKGGAGIPPRRGLPRHRQPAHPGVHPPETCPPCTTSSKNWPTSTSPKRPWRSAPLAIT